MASIMHDNATLGDISAILLPYWSGLFSGNADTDSYRVTDAPCTEPSFPFNYTPLVQTPASGTNNVPKVI